MADRSAQVRAAMEAFSIKQEKIRKREQDRLLGKGKRNKKPEKEVEKEVLTWAKGAKVFLHVIESKATYSRSAGGYFGSPAESGFPDLVGNYKHLALFVELKAKGKRSTLRDGQRVFLENKIRQGAFAVVTDSALHIENIFNKWVSSKDLSDRTRLLMEDLPKKKATQHE